MTSTMSTFDPAAGRAVLARTPQVLHAWLADLPPAWLDSNEGANSWSPRVIAAHLLHAERHNWMPRATTLLHHGVDMEFPPFDPNGQLHVPLDESAGSPRMADAPISALLDAFAAQRTSSLATFDTWGLGPDMLARTGRHPRFGEVTLGQLLATWVTHDLAHLAQIARVMAKQHTDAVGPWRAFLPILER